MAKNVDAERRDLILYGNLWKVLWVISGPMMFMNIMTYAYTIIDSILVADIGAMEASAVAITNQIKGVLQAVSVGLSIPSTILLARLIGRNDMEKTRALAHILTVLGAVVGAAVCGLGIFGARGIMILSRVPDSLIVIGQTYFTIQIVTLGITVFNNVFLAFEKSRGATANIFIINLVQIIIKVALTVLFVKGLGYGVTMVAVATLIPALGVMGYCILRLASKNYIYHFRWNELHFDGHSVRAVGKLATPIALGKVVFSAGKVIANTMVVAMGDTVVGALSISNSLSAGTTTITESTEEIMSVIISQNLGNQNKKRAMQAFFMVLGVNIGISLIGTIIYQFQIEQLVYLFASDDPDFYNKIYTIFNLERWGVIALGVNSAFMGLLYGFGYAKASYILSIVRLFLFRIPILYVLINMTDLGVVSAGYAMLISNAAVGAIAIVYGSYVLFKINRDGGVKEII